MRNNDTAMQAFLAAKSDIDALLDRLKALSEDHFEAHPDSINWGDVTALQYYRERLREIADKAFHEGEYAA